MDRMSQRGHCRLRQQGCCLRSTSLQNLSCSTRCIASSGGGGATTPQISNSFWTRLVDACTQARRYDRCPTTTFSNARPFTCKGCGEDPDSIVERVKRAYGDAVSQPLMGVRSLLYALYFGELMCCRIKLQLSRSSPAPPAT